MNSAVISFNPDGSVEAMHRDDFSLEFLGKQSITRASEIVFDEDSQNWSIVLTGSKLSEIPDDARGIPGYDVARKIEVLWLDTCRLHSEKPLSDIGLTFLKQSRLEILK